MSTTEIEKPRKAPNTQTPRVIARGKRRTGSHVTARARNLVATGTHVPRSWDGSSVPESAPPPGRCRRYEKQTLPCRGGKSSRSFNRLLRRPCTRKTHLPFVSGRHTTAVLGTTPRPDARNVCLCGAITRALCQSRTRILDVNDFEYPQTQLAKRQTGPCQRPAKQNKPSTS